MTVLEDVATTVGDRLRLDADLRLDVDGQHLQLSGAGRHLVLHADRAADLVTAAARARGPLGGRRLATALDELGLTLDVRDAGGLVVRLGRDAGTGVVGGVLAAPVSLGPRGRRWGRLAVGLVVAALLAAVVAGRR